MNKMSARQGLWSVKFPHCIRCGTTEKRHSHHGFCIGCATEVFQSCKKQASQDIQDCSARYEINNAAALKAHTKALEVRRVAWHAAATKKICKQKRAATKRAKKARAEDGLSFTSEDFVSKLSDQIAADVLKKVNAGLAK